MRESEGRDKIEAMFGEGLVKNTPIVVRIRSHPADDDDFLALIKALKKKQLLLCKLRDKCEHKLSDLQKKTVRLPTLRSFQSALIRTLTICGKLASNEVKHVCAMLSIH